MSIKHSNDLNEMLIIYLYNESLDTIRQRCKIWIATESVAAAISLD
jgi:hypothetical protein